MIFLFTLSIMCTVEKTQKDLAVIKTVLIMKNIIPVDLDSKGNSR
jgi:hypothetical protein